MPVLLRLALICSALTASASAQSPPAIIHAGLPLVSPSSPRILFQSNRTGKNQLWLINADGTGERQLTNRNADVSHAQWARNGKSILYSVMTGDSSRLYEMWPDTTLPERLVGSFPGRAPELSPSRSQILYASGPYSSSRLVMTDSLGGGARQVTGDAWNVWSGVWSPDARQIAYTASNKSGISVWVMNADGSQARQLTHLTPQEGRAQMPAWSPDSHHLAFQANASSPRGKSTIWVVEVATGAAREVLPHTSAYTDETPSWFSDSNKVAFQSNRSGRTEVWTINTDGTDLFQVTGRR
jgi:Tol biopolymer transport system component